MRVGIDGYNLALPHGTGIATYGFSLGAVLAGAGIPTDGIFGIDAGKHAPIREALFYDRLAHGRRERPGAVRRFARTVASILPLSAHLEDIVDTVSVETREFADRLPPFDRIVTAPFLFERAHRRFMRTGQFTTVRMTAQPDVMHWTYPVPVRLEGAANIYTLHDLVPLRLPYASTESKKRYHDLASACVREAAHICTVSEASRSDIIGILGADPSRVTNTYQISPLAPSVRGLGYTDSHDAKSVKSLFGLEPGGYFLFYGAVEPKKNVGRLIEALLSLEGDTPLVLVSGRGWLAEPSLRLISGGSPDSADSGTASRRVIRMDFLPRRLLLPLVQGARAVTFPSLFEGFGLPVHEAMLLGVPVLAGATSALHEVAGDAALLVDPYDVGAIRQALRRLDTEPDLRASLSVRGAAHAAQFTPDRFLEALRTAYSKALDVVR